MGKKSLEKNDVWNGFPKKYIGPYMHKKISLMGYFLNRISLSPQKFVFYIFLLIKTGFPENNEGIAHNSQTYVHSHTKTPTEKPTQTETDTVRQKISKKINTRPTCKKKWPFYKTKKNKNGKY